ncbi:hypothetical protein D6Z43_08060 [Pseudomonas sp. DY-1]|nr:hypothetical protein D6Z43_08060 [Pseudomonas sp. DY-1]
METSACREVFFHDAARLWRGHTRAEVVTGATDQSGRVTLQAGGDGEWRRSRLMTLLSLVDP